MVCDPCHLSFRKCSLQRPNCNECTRLGLLCTWDETKINNDGIYNRVTILSKNNDKSFGISIQKPQHYQPHIKLKFTKKQIKVIKSNKLNKTNNIIRNFSISKTHSICLSERRINKEWGCKANYQVSLCIFYKFSGITNGMVQQERDALHKIFHSIVETMTKKSCKKVTTVDNLKQKVLEFGFLRYFNNLNSLYPFFTLQGYKARKRSRLLYLAICNTGLKLLPPNEQVDILISSIEKEFYSLFSFSNLEFTLDTVQSLLIFSSGTIMYSRNSKIYTFIQIAGTILRSLGVDKAFPKAFSLEYKTEVALARNNMNRLGGVLFHYFKSSSSECPATDYSFKLNCNHYNDQFNIKLGWYSRSFSYDDEMIFSYFEEILYLIYGNGMNLSGFLLRQVTYILNTSTLSPYQTSQLVIKQEQKMKLNLHYHLYQISHIAKYFLPLLKSDRNRAKLSLLSMKAWSVLVLSGVNQIFFVMDLVTFPSEDSDYSIISCFYSATQSTLEYAKSFLQTLNNINLNHHFIAFTAYSLTIMSRFLLTHIRFYFQFKGSCLPSLSSYQSCLSSMLQKLTSLKKVLFYSHAATSSIDVLKVLFDFCNYKYPNLILE